MFVFPETFVKGIIHPHFFVHENTISLLPDAFVKIEE